MTISSIVHSLPTVSSEEAERDFSGLLDRVHKDRSTLVVTRQDQSVAVMLPACDYEALMRLMPNLLESHFDQLVADMQTPAHCEAVDRLFGASPEQLGDAAARAKT